MKYTRITALAAISLAATLSLTACGNGNDGSGKDSSSQGSSSSTSSSSGGSAKSESGSGSSSSSSSSSDGSSKSEGGSGSGEDTEARAGAGNGATTTGGKVTFCKTEDLAIDARDASPDEKTGTIDITMINRGSTTCSATGFAGVDIKDTDHTSEPISRGHAQPRITTLKPGDAAVFNLSYTIDTSGNSVAHPTNIQVTPPNETHTVNLPWPAGAGEIKGGYTEVEVYPTHTTN
ncbi:DUF4232 domain-containing protein [Streptomyces sp. NPDC088348]|uniref:DUF4232 domain-containing protein n=1 Tax=Streptomyces sp. NPDC088348 TaxID=3365853 RepID=UPI00381727F3